MKGAQGLIPDQGTRSHMLQLRPRAQSHDHLHECRRGNNKKIRSARFEFTLCMRCWKHFCMHSLFSLHDIPPRLAEARIKLRHLNPGSGLDRTHSTTACIVPILVMSKFRQPLLGLDSSIQPLALQSDKSWYICLYHSLAL